MVERGTTLLSCKSFCVSILVYLDSWSVARGLDRLTRSHIVSI